MLLELLVRVLLIVVIGVVPASALAAGDAGAGRTKSEPCKACHGADGNAVADIYPTLAGQNERYLLRQMLLIKAGTRAAPLMAGQLDSLAEQDLTDLAAHYAMQRPNVGEALDDAPLLALGERIYRFGILEKQVAACTACHSPHGAGNDPAGFPQIRGQPVNYLVDQLKAFREGTRATDEEYGGMMREVAARLTDGEIRALANYVHGLMN